MLLEDIPRPTFSIRYIRIRWSEKRVLLGITTSLSEVFLNPVESDIFSAEVVTYNRIKDGQHSFIGQLAIISESEPIIEKSKTKWMQVSDPVIGTKYWVEKGAWCKKSRIFEAPLCSHTGQVDLRIGEQTCKLIVHPAGFTTDEFDSLLDDFIGDALRLLMEDGSSTFASLPGMRASTLPDDEALRSMRRFLSCVENAMSAPLCELREVLTLQPAHRVRFSVPHTFRDIAVRGQASRMLTGRAHSSTLDTPENRYLAYMTDRLFRLTDRLALRLGRQSKALQARAKMMHERAEHLAERRKNNSRLLNREVAVNAREALHRRAEATEINRKAACDRWVHKYENESSNVETRKFEFQVIQVISSEKTDSLHEEYFVKIRCKHHEENKNKFNYRIRYIKIPRIFYNDDVFLNKEEYRIDADFKISKDYVEPVIIINYVKSLIPLTVSSAGRRAGQIKKDIDERDLLGLKAWKIDLYSGENEELEKEEKSVRLGTKITQNGAEAAKKSAEELTHLSIALLRLREKLRKAGILTPRESGGMVDPPSSMAFVTNPAYAGALGSYRRILNQGNLTPDRLEKVLALEKVPLLDQPTIYERWALLKIILVLEQLGFSPENGVSTRDQLVCAVADVAPKAKNKFRGVWTNVKLARQVTLEYEWEMMSGHQDYLHPVFPDFCLTFARTIEGKEGIISRLILDTKCKNYIYNIDASANLLEEDIHNIIKKYRRVNEHPGKPNRIFIVHPSLNASPPPVTPQEWASKGSYYGGSPVFKFEGTEMPNHNHGIVLLRPTSPHTWSDEDNLHRVIAMALELDQSDGLNRFCIVCGSEKIDVKVLKTNKGHKFHCVCKTCQHFFVDNHCQKCPKRLLKHGSYWTYHDIDPLSPFHICCPSCGAWYEN